MAAAIDFGYALIALSAVLLALHWQRWRETRGFADAAAAERIFARLQLQRRSVASGLIGVVGAALASVDCVPKNPQAATAYLFGLLIAATVIMGIAILDLRAVRLQREGEHLEVLAKKVQEVQQRES